LNPQLSKKKPLPPAKPPAKLPAKPPAKPPAKLPAKLPVKLPVSKRKLNATSQKKKKTFQKIESLQMPTGMSKWVNTIKAPLKKLGNLMDAEVVESEEDTAEEVDKFSLSLY
jgi:hypothetical protein